MLRSLLSHRLTPLAKYMSYLGHASGHVLDPLAITVALYQLLVVGVRVSIVHVEKTKHNLRGPVVHLAVTLDIVLGRLQIYLVDLVKGFRIIFVLDRALDQCALSLSLCPSASFLLRSMPSTASKNSGGW